MRIGALYNVWAIAELHVPPHCTLPLQVYVGWHSCHMRYVFSVLLHKNWDPIQNYTPGPNVSKCLGHR